MNRKPPHIAQAVTQVPARKKVAPRSRVISPASNRLPSSSNAKPLHVKNAKGGGRSKIDGNLKKKSCWYNAIQNPAQGSGVKIPDDVALQTGTLQLCLETSFDTNAAGLGGLQTICLHPNNVPGGLGTYPGQNFQKLNPASSVTPPTMAWLAADGFPTNEVLRSYSVGVRVVSAALYVQPEVSLADAKGEMIVGFRPWGYTTSVNLDTYRNEYGTAIMPLNVCKPMKTLWTPISYGEQTYSAFYNPDWVSFGGGETDCPNWCLYCIVNGTAGVQTFRVRIVVNYEFVPNENAIDIVSANPSPMDSTEVDLVESWVASEPATRMSSNAEMSAAPGASIEAKLPQDGGDSGFGMFVDVIGEIMPYVVDGIEGLSALI